MSKDIEIAIHAGFDNYIVDKHISELVGQAGEEKYEMSIRTRIKVAEYLKNTAKETTKAELADDGISCGVFKFKEKGHEKYAVRVMGRDGILHTGAWIIKKVDTHKLWLLNNYDGAEIIQYYTVNELNELVCDYS